MGAQRASMCENATRRRSVAIAAVVLIGYLLFVRFDPSLFVALIGRYALFFQFSNIDLFTALFILYTGAFVSTALFSSRTERPIRAVAFHGALYILASALLAAPLYLIPARTMLGIGTSRGFAIIFGLALYAAPAVAMYLIIRHDIRNELTVSVAAAGVVFTLWLLSSGLIAFYYLPAFVAFGFVIAMFILNARRPLEGEGRDERGTEHTDETQRRTRLGRRLRRAVRRGYDRIVSNPKRVLPTMLTAALLILLPLLGQLGVSYESTMDVSPTLATGIELMVDTERTHSSTERSGFSVSADDHGLTVTHAAVPGGTVLRFSFDEPFVTAKRAETLLTFNRGSFIFDRFDLGRCDRTVDGVVEMSGEHTIKISGELIGLGDRIPYTLELTAVGDAQLRFELALQNAAAENGARGADSRVALSFASPPSEHIYGCGEQYSHLDLKGHRVPIWVEEQGLGRGSQPLAGLLDLVSPGSAGDAFTTYAPVPYFITSRNRALLLENTQRALFDFSHRSRITLEVCDSTLSGYLFAGATPREILEDYTGHVGRMPPLPDWVHDGAVVRVHGGSEAVRETVTMYRNAGVDLTAVWVEDWAGERETITGNRLWWNWVPDRTRYPDWEELLAELRNEGVRTLIYFNPHFVDASAKRDGRNLYAEGCDAGYFVRRCDGEYYLIDNGGFEAAMLDLTNEDARAWMRQLMVDQLEAGVAGWMADFGEALPTDAVLASGADPDPYHNRYPEEWARLNREALARTGQLGEALFFCRSAFTHSPAYTTLFWTGDQTVTWDAQDGLKTVVTALLSSGLSGFALNHCDIGGYLSVDNLFVSLTRTPELHRRWIELAAFTALLRTHETNERALNHQVYSDSVTLAQFARFTSLFRALSEYRSEMVAEANSTGLPLVRHPLLHYPDDPTVYELQWQFMFGDAFMVAPVLDPGRDSIDIYLPAGHWCHLFSNRTIENGEGRWFEVSAPVGEPAVFYRPEALDATTAAAIEHWSASRTPLTSPEQCV